MSKKHFIAFANMVNRFAEMEGLTTDQKFELAACIADVCAIHSQNFDRVRFYEACKD